MIITRKVVMMLKMKINQFHDVADKKKPKMKIIRREIIAIMMTRNSTHG